ncbi:hypothetical protein DCAR_0727552 [Daucus carota subsp. sativus]|uniref:Uncharacterized protein n=1 Tax=Daucus carota subsp. sativus TaxID=79200 RepID=A0A164T0F3_DAUCS|nr:hypothetical protein DCAR_0727552 [Daucus carota subsp. sativus]
MSVFIRNIVDCKAAAAMSAYVAQEEDIYTKDGTTDYRHKPAVKSKTGTWKACPYILDDAMRSLCSALSLTTAALGNYLSTSLVNMVTDVSTRNGGKGWIPDILNYGHLDYFFWMLALSSVMNLGVYVLVAKCYTYTKPVDPISQD